MKIFVVFGVILASLAHQTTAFPAVDESEATEATKPEATIAALPKQPVNQQLQEEIFKNFTEVLNNATGLTVEQRSILTDIAGTITSVVNAVKPVVDAVAPIAGALLPGLFPQDNPQTQPEPQPPAQQPAPEQQPVPVQQPVPELQPQQVAAAPQYAQQQPAQGGGVSINIYENGQCSSGC